jgi:hypothetical protein
VLWLVWVLVVTWAGYPGVVCVTPLAWLIALRVGLLCATQSPSPLPRARLLEAALAGAWLGWLQGVLFWGIMGFLGDVRPDEQASSTVLTVLMMGVGMLVSAGLAWFTAFLTEQRRAREA